MSKLSTIPSIGLGFGQLLAAGPSFARAVTRDCEARFFSRAWSEDGRQDEEGSRGTWRSTLDRRRSTFHIRVRDHDPVIRYRSDIRYFGQRQPASERQF
jgi:hypothetical protein